MEIGDRIALALQALRQKAGVDVRRPLLRIDYRREAAAAPFRFDMIGGKLHRRGCTAISRSAHTALYSIWEARPELPAVACEECRPAPEEAVDMRQDASFDIIYGLLSVVDQFGSVLRERGREFRKSSRGRRVAQDLRQVFAALDETQQQALQLSITSLDSLAKAIQRASQSLEQDNQLNGRGKNGRPPARRPGTSKKS
jgi:hypothetical protein